jgi:hypothetical protein
MAAIGKDCDLMLYHQNVAGGQPVGFLLDRSRLYHGSVSVYRTAYQGPDGEFVDHQLVGFTLLIGANLINPDASMYTSGSDAYRQLFDLLKQRSEIGVITPEGVFSGLYSSGNYAIEERSGGVLRVTIQLNSDGAIFAPADRERFEQSAWVDEDTYHGAMTWDNSYWRS